MTADPYEAAIEERKQEVRDKIDKVRSRGPRLKTDTITLAHGAGGKASAALLDAVFLKAFRNDALEQLGDSGVVRLPSGDRLAISTDSFVVNPRRFPGGSIGDLAVNGTVNDLAVAGAQPRWLSVGFVLEEGLTVEELQGFVDDMRRAADAAGVQIVTGDTKVVDTGSADGVFVNTAGIGLIPEGRELHADLVQPGDAVVVSGTIGDHGMAVMLARGDLALEATIESDTAPLNGMVEDLLEAAPNTRWLRDPTRGGVGTVLNELAKASGLGVIMAESALPVDTAVNSACDILGIDPLYVANEGKLVAVIPPDELQDAMAALRSHPHGGNAAVIGEIRKEPPATVIIQTGFGGSRVVDMLVGDPLPRIC